MNTLTGHYALLQLSPLPDSEEVVNVGVYLLCPQAGWAELACSPELPSRARAMFPICQSGSTPWRWSNWLRNWRR